MKFLIELHDEHFTLLAMQAQDHYRDVKSHAAWLIACAVSATATAEADTEPCPGCGIVTAGPGAVHRAHGNADE